MFRILGLFILVTGAGALKISAQSKFSSKGVSAQALWEQAWSQTLDKFHVASQAQLPDSLQQDLQHEAKKLWKSWLKKRQALIQEREATETTTTDAPEQPEVVQRLTAGMKDIHDDDTPMRTTTTTTEDPAEVERREQQEELHEKAVGRLVQGVKEAREDPDQLKKWEAKEAEKEMETMTTTTVNFALSRLLAGIDDKHPAMSDDDTSFAQAPVAKSTTTVATTTTTTTTTTEDPQIEADKEKAAAIKTEAMSKLTAGFLDVDKKEAAIDATRTTTTASSTTTTTTTQNAALKRLMEGVDGPAAPAAKNQKHQTSTTTTTTTVSTTMGETGRKELAFLTSGSFAMPTHKLQDTQEADSKDDDDSSDDEKKSDDGEAAADFDMDSAA